MGKNKDQFILNTVISKSISLILLIVLVVSFVGFNSEFPIIEVSSKSLDLDSPVFIDSDSALMSYASGGSGSEGDPYRLENLVIETTGQGAIYITGTTQHFIIKNCTLSTNETAPAIQLYNVTEGTACVENNTCFNSDRGIIIENTPSTDVVANNASFNIGEGIWIWNSPSSYLFDNICNYNNITGTGPIISAGISFMNSPSSIILNNTCSYNFDRYGMLLQDSSDTIVANNTCFYNDLDGIVIWWSDNCLISDNSLGYNGRFGLWTANTLDTAIYRNNLYYNGLYFREYEIENALSQDVQNNNVNGLPVGYFENLTDYSITASYGQLILVNCSDVEILGQEYSATSIGILLLFSNECTVDGTTCNNNKFAGLFMRYCNNLEITNSIFSKNHYGIVGTAVESSIFDNNTCDRSSSTGISIWNSQGSNVITNNILTKGVEYGISLYSAGEGTNITGNTILESGWDGISSVFTNNMKIVGNNCSSSGHSNIFLNQSHGVSIEDNFCAAGSWNGIALLDCQNPVIVNNDCLKNWIGIRVEWSPNAVIMENYCNSSGEHGIFIQYCEFPHIAKNVCTFNLKAGIYVRECPDTTVDKNIATDNILYGGMSLWFSDWSNITSNHFSNNLGDGMAIIHTNSVTVKNNTYSDNANIGLGLWTADSNVIIDNIFEGNGNYSITLQDWPWDGDYNPSTGNIIYHNIIRNNLANSSNSFTSQGLDNGVNNVWYNKILGEGNNWDDFAVSDEIYEIDGSAESIDLYPYGNYHTLEQTTITSPNGGEILNGTVTITWTTSQDSHGHTITYSLFYSDDGGATWFEIVSELTTTSYDWETKRLANGSNYLIKVVTSCSEGWTSDGVSDSPFTIYYSEPFTETSVTTEVSETPPETTSDLLTPGFNFSIFIIGCFIIFLSRKKYNSG